MERLWHLLTSGCHNLFADTVNTMPGHNCQADTLISLDNELLALKSYNHIPVLDVLTDCTSLASEDCRLV
jgi:hypothetical protein